MGKVVEIPADMTARDLCQLLVYKSHCVDDNSWALVEHHPLLGLGKETSPAGLTYCACAHNRTQEHTWPQWLKCTQKLCTTVTDIHRCIYIHAPVSSRITCVQIYRCTYLYTCMQAYTSILRQTDNSGSYSHALLLLIAWGRCSGMSACTYYTSYACIEP